MSSKRGSAAAGLSVLVVDDDDGVRQFLQFVLTQQGYRVRAVADGSRVIEALREGPVHFVLLDLMMPEQHGLTTLEQIRNHDADLPVIILTGYPETESAVSALRLRADDYLAKPFSPADLLAAIDRALAARGLPRTSEEWLRRRLGERIRSLRLAESLSQTELAERASLSPAQVSQIERAQSSPSLEALHRLSQTLSVSLSELFKGL